MTAPRKAKLRVYCIKYTWDCPHCGGLNFVDLLPEHDEKDLDIVICSRCHRKRGATVSNEWSSDPSPKLMRKLKLLQKRFFASLKKGKPRPLKRLL